MDAMLKSPTFCKMVEHYGNNCQAATTAFYFYLLLKTSKEIHPQADDYWIPYIATNHTNPKLVTKAKLIIRTNGYYWRHASMETQKSIMSNELGRMENNYQRAKIVILIMDMNRVPLAQMFLENGYPIYNFW
jgi:hypothetical protein